MSLFGLIGKNIAYSFSENYFTQKFQSENIEDSSYSIFDLDEIDHLNKLFEISDLKGFNVTIPYKEAIIPFLDELSQEAAQIGAVNCVKIVDGKKMGFNTDVYGFEHSLKPLLKLNHKNALIFGDGGAAKAVRFVLDKLKIAHQTVTRNGDFRYENVDEFVLAQHQILINSTPVGTFPAIDETLPIPFQYITFDHLVFDLIYNPPKTKFLELAQKKGAICENGYEMLRLQADKSWEIWNQPL